MAEIVDTLHGGREHVIGAWMDGAAVIDPGPASTVERVLDALGDREPEAILLTHIHLDHAGAAGTLAARFPDAVVYVHEVGAPHVIDPSRLWSSAARLYGEENMRRLWGEVQPVAEDRVVALDGGERVAGFEVLHTPGHAAHHVAYLGGDGSAYVGDLAGVRVPPGEVTVMPTPPPEIDLEAWEASLERLAGAKPERLRLTHFGEAEAESQLARAREALAWAADESRPLDRERFAAALEQRIDGQPEAAAASMRAAMPPEQVWMGLERYWRKRDAG